jgi:hypothetical protein
MNNRGVFYKIVAEGRLPLPVLPVYGYTLCKSQRINYFCSGGFGYRKPNHCLFGLRFRLFLEDAAKKLLNAIN